MNNNNEVTKLYTKYNKAVKARAIQELLDFGYGEVDNEAACTGQEANPQVPDELVEDVCQDVWLRVIEGLDTYNEDKAGSYAWLSRIVHNVVFDLKNPDRQKVRDWQEAEENGTEFKSWEYAEFVSIEDTGAYGAWADKAGEGEEEGCVLDDGEDGGGRDFVDPNSRSPEQILEERQELKIALQKLNPREIAYLSGVAEGLTAKEISQRHNVSEGSVRQAISRARKTVAK